MSPWQHGCKLKILNNLNILLIYWKNSFFELWVFYSHDVWAPFNLNACAIKGALNDIKDKQPTPVEYQLSNRAHCCFSLHCSKASPGSYSHRFISGEEPRVVPPSLQWPHTSSLVWAHIKCFSHPSRPLKVNNSTRMRHLLRSYPILHSWQVSVCTKVCKEREGGRMEWWCEETKHF